MSGLDSLLKYRFQPRSAGNIHKSQENGTSVSPKAATVAIVPDSPVGKNMSSPVFNRTKPLTGRAAVLVIESDSDEGSPIKRKTSSAALNSSFNNGIEQYDKFECPPEMEEHYSTLQSMFPNLQRDRIIEVLHKNHNNLDDSINALIAWSNRSDFSRTSTWNVRPSSQNFPSQNSTCSQSSTTSGPSQPAYKRIRMISDSSGDEGVSKALSMTENDKLKALFLRFPNSTSEIRRKSLHQCSMDLPKATALMGQWMNEPVSLTSNVGSIKAFKAVQMKATLQQDVIELQDSDDEDEDDVEIVPEDAVVTSTHSKSYAKEEDTRKGRSGGGDLLSLNDNAEIDEDDDVSDSDSEDEEKPEIQSPLLEFLNKAVLEELVSMPGCSKKKKVPTATLR